MYGWPELSVNAVEAESQDSKISSTFVLNLAYTLIMNTPSISPGTEQCVQAQTGPLTVDGQHGSYVLMSREVYDAMLGISEQEDAETLASVLRGIRDLEEGRTHDVDQAFNELDSRHAS